MVNLLMTRISLIDKLGRGNNFIATFKVVGLLIFVYKVNK